MKRIEFTVAEIIYAYDCNFVQIKEGGRTFKSEYIISQSIMMACKRLGYDGVAYYSKRVYDEIFARCAINLHFLLTIMGIIQNL